MYEYTNSRIKVYKYNNEDPFSNQDDNLKKENKIS